MTRASVAELLNKQLQVIDMLCGKAPEDQLFDRVGLINVVYDYYDFADNDLYIEVKKEYVSRVRATLNKAKIYCEETERISNGEELLRWLDFPGHSKKKRLLFGAGSDDEYVIIKTKLKRDKVYHLISDMVEFEKHNVKVEVIVVDTREVDEYADFKAYDG